MNVEEKVLEKAADGLIKGAKQLLFLFIAAIFCAAATATDPFFRKNMGERYFTPFRCWLSAMAWYALIYVARELSPTLGQLYNAKIHRFATVIGAAIFVAYLVLSRLNMNAMRRRRATGELWHSRSKGESLFGRENWIRDVIIAFVVMIALNWFVSIFHGLFFLLSRLMGYAADELARRALYNRYLDVIDGTIEAQFMESALRDGFPPSLTGGVYAPLPKVFRGERRASVARIIAGGAVSDQTAANPPDAARSASKQTYASPSQPWQSSEAGSTTQSENRGRATKSAAFATLLKSSELRFGVIGVLAIILAAWVFASLRSSQQRKSSQVAQTNPKNNQVTQIKQTASAPVITEPRAATPTVAPAAEVKSNADTANSAALAQAALEAQRRQEEEKATAQAALEAQKRQEQERLVALEQQKRDERAKLIEQINNTITNQVALLSQFKSNCQTRLDNNTNKLAKVATSSRKTLTKTNNEFREQIAKNVQGQETSLDNVQKDMLAASAHTGLDPAPLKDQLADFIKSMDKDHDTITRLLNDLDVSISNAPPKRGLFDFNIK